MRTTINLCSRFSLLLLCLTVAPLSVSRADPAVSGAWSFTGSMHDARQQHPATLLLDGRVLVAGGTVNGVSLTSAELYDPNTGVWSLTGSLNEGRFNYTATLLADGRVLVAGGLDYGPPQRVLKSAELYDPATGTWSQTGRMAVAREWHTATLLPDGKVLVAGGGTVHEQSAELYDPDTGTWGSTGDLEQRLAFHTATLLQDGEVLVAGGVSGFAVTRSAELYNVETGLWNLTDSLAKARYLHTLTLLPDGMVLVAGGFSFNNGYHTYRSAELYDPLSATWGLTGSMHEARASHTANLLYSGKVLVAGGGADSSQTTSCEEYDPITQTWAHTGPLNVARVLHTATLLSNGKVLAAGGANSNGWLASAELFDPNARQ
jgi:Kelch motif